MNGYEWSIAINVIDVFINMIITASSWEYVSDSSIISITFCSCMLTLSIQGLCCRLFIARLQIRLILMGLGYRAWVGNTIYMQYLWYFSTSMLFLELIYLWLILGLWWIIWQLGKELKGIRFLILKISSLKYSILSVMDFLIMRISFLQRMTRILYNGR